MPAIDFKEIPEAHLGGGLQDTFELFARDYLACIGYKIEEDPSRGADGGKDIIVTEVRKGIGGETIIKWLVSCKHKAHSGASINPSDEANINDRVSTHNCNGFIGFYSTLASSGLANTLESFKKKMEVIVYDKEKIESNLLKTSEGLQLALRYFPKSTKEWIDKNPIQNSNNTKIDSKDHRVAESFKNALSWFIGSLGSFLILHGYADGMKIILKDFPDEKGKNYPAPNIVDPIIKVLSTNTIKVESNTWIIGGRKLLWAEVFVNDLNEVNGKCNKILDHYSDRDDILISRIEEIKNRADRISKIISMSLSHPSLTTLYDKGIPDVHIEEFRYFILSSLKSYRIIRQFGIKVE